MVDRLAEDHANASNLAAGLAEMSGISVDPAKVKTNIVYIDIVRKDMNAQSLSEKLNINYGVKVLPTAIYQLRAVTNYHVTANDVESVLTAFNNALK